MVPYGRFSLLFALVFVSLWEETILLPTIMSKMKDITVQSAYDRKFVRVLNKLESTNTEFNLTVHCKSKDDDLGAHVLRHDQYFEWSFYVNFWGTTLFFCGLNWHDASKSFDAYKLRRDKKRCNHCLWEVRNDGVYGFTDSGKNDIKIGW